MRSTSALLTGAAAALALMLLPALAFAQDERAPAPPPTSGAGAPSAVPSPSPSQPSSSTGGQGGSYSGSGGQFQAPGQVDGSWRNSPQIGPPSRGGTGGSGIGSGPGYTGPPSRVELPAPRLDPPGGVPRPVQPLPPGLMPRDPTPPSFSPPENMRMEIPGFVTSPGRSGQIGPPEDGRRLQAIELVSPDPGNHDDLRVLPPPDDGTVVTPPIEKRKPPEPPKPPMPSDPGAPNSTEQWLWRVGLWNYYGYGWRDYWAEFGWWSRGCFMPNAMSEEDEFWSRVTGVGDPFYYGGCGYGGYATNRYYGYGYGYGYGNSYGYWMPLGWYGQVYGGRYLGYGYGAAGYGWMRGNPCAVVSVETYSGRRYRMVAELPQLGGFGPRSLRAAVLRQLDEDGEVALAGHGNQELHLYAGFVKQVSARWCEGAEY